VTVGEALTQARAQAGLSVDELSERTRIRGTVIRSIEDDDYEACGGDLYVRGYVRALAGAVGIDAQPLIREFDQGRANGAHERANGAAGGHANGAPSAPPPDAAQTAFDLPVVAEAPADDTAPGDDSAPGEDRGPADLDATRFDLPVVSADPAATAYDLPVLPRTAELPLAEPPAAAPPPAATETRFDLAAVPDDLMAAGYELKPAETAAADSETKIIPALGTDPADSQVTAGQPVPVLPGTAKAVRGRGKRRGLLALGAVVVLAAAGGVGAYLATGNTAKNTAATSAANQSAASAAAKSSAAAKASAAAEASVSAAAQASASAQASAAASKSAAAAQRVISLPVASAAAFGPDGFADGDNPGNAKFAIARNATQPWQSQWYATSQFGMLKHGTGLLLDLGKKATVTSVRLDLGPFGGTDMQIRVGNGPAPQDLRVAATASGVGGVVKLTLRHPATARYVLLWFTQLPSDGAGHYQESVSQVVVSGRR
jgi:cytoskeletal protein RodZ